MYVYEKMSKDVRTLTPYDSVNTALELMKTNGFHRVPIVDRGVLVGLITQGVIEAATPSVATSLSIYEINYLLSKAVLKDIMIKDVVTISKDALLEEAAVSMRKSNVGALPVMDGSSLVGIITIKDIFDAFIDLSGYHDDNVRYVIDIKDDKVGVLNDITACFKQADISLTSLAVYHNGDDIYVQVQATNDSEDVKNQLKGFGYSIKDIIDLKSKHEKSH